jgi:carbon-monoxide dehydrogenase large subunit
MNLETPEPILRVDGPEKVSGAATYAGDVRLPGLLVGMALRSPFPHARIRAIDVAAARNVPGVLAVLTAADLPTTLIGKSLQDMPLLARDRVRYVGEKVAVVAAETRDAAEAALAAITVDYEELPALSNVDDALAPGAPELHPDKLTYKRGHGYPELPDEPNVNSLLLLEKGDVDEGFRQAVHISEDEFRLPMQHVAFLEPHACTVAIDPDGKVRVWTCVKLPFSVPKFMAEATGLPADRFVTMPARIGGDFGGKGYLMDEPLAYFLAQASGRPVQMVMRMNDEFQGGIPRHGALIRIKSGLDAEGRLIARECQLYWDSGAYAAYRAAANMTGARRAAGAYAIPNIRVISRCLWTNHMPCGSMRAPGHPQVTFACESHTDLLARRMGLDPVELRRRNLVKKGEVMLDGSVIADDSAPVILQKALDAFDWSAPLPPGHGRALAFSERGTGGGNASIQVSVDAMGTVLARTGTPEQGAGQHTMVQQVVARTLGVPARLVRVEQGDTDNGPFDQGPGGSHTTNATGGAALTAATRVRDRLRDLAAESQGWQADAVAIENGAFVAHGERVEFRELAARLVQLEGGLIAEDADNRASSGPSGFACLAAEVAVDQDTGQVRIEKLVAVHDVGYAINPIGVVGQIHGGLLQGLGQALMEELRIVDGRPQVANFSDYKMFNVADIPDLRIELIEEGDGPGPFGAKGVGEISALTPPPALANAVDAAVGVRITDLPITAEKIFAALQARASSNGG